ncbi:MAG TPA: carboxypeptidase M32 [Pirellulaceae bacterium]|nr:carboxypeptidase M32 [Pirellulaceae bacterium]
MSNSETTYTKLCEYVRETALLESIEALLGWDERTYMPLAAGAYRADQITYLSGRIHQRRTDPRLKDWLDELAESPLAKEPHSDTAATIRQLRRNYQKQVKLPQKLVEELSRAAVLGQQVWVDARKANNYAAFEPTLKQMFKLQRQKAAALGYKESPYDALLDEYEPDETASNVTRVLAALRQELVPLVQAIGAGPKQPPIALLERHFPAAAQEQFGKLAAAKIGFSFDRGRLDVTHHPFCSGMGPHDCRITTRYDESFFPSAFFGILHEAGHGLYEQGLRPELYALPPGMYLSLGIHESQSRMWENLVGRSRAFWDCFYPQAKTAFPAALGDVALDDFYFAINDVRPSLIRVEADEATYNLHIIVRFELEQALIRGDLSTADLPGAWNDKYQEYLGITPPSDADGVLQDVHWSAGLVGYFPTYSLGNLYAAQFFATADKELGGLDASFAKGEFGGLLDWLRRNIHQRGQCYTASELVKEVTGQPLSHGPLMQQLHSKYGTLFGVNP